MKKLSLQWRITLMTVLLIGATCVAMNLLLSYSGRRYMDSIGSYMTNYGETDKGEPDFFDPEREKLDQELTIVIHGAQNSFATTGWYITVAVTVLSGVLAYFFSGHALKPLRTFASQVEQVQPNNLPDMKITESCRNSGCSANRSTGCWNGLTQALPPSGSSPETPPTNCARRWR